MTRLLDRIDRPQDLHGLTEEQLQQVAQEVREHIIDTVGEIGGHFGANLGTCEIAVALHSLLDSPSYQLIRMLGRYKSFAHDWEEPYLRDSDERIFKNTFRDIDTILRSCAENGTRFEIECYDIGHLYTAAHFLERGLIKPPLVIQGVFGILGGIGAHTEDVAHMKRTADRLFGDDYLFSVLGAGRNQMPVATQSLLLGGNVRVGLEDSLWDAPGKLAASNAVQVQRIRAIAESLALQVATPDEARQLLGLKGRTAVAF